MRNATTMSDGRDPAFDAECAAKIAEYQKQCELEELAWTKANRTAIKTLRTKLLAIGGDRISSQPHPDIRLLAKYGGLMEFSPKLKEMEPCHCHENVERLWSTRTPRSRLIGIATGYVLGDDQDDSDGVWRPHSWALSKTKSVISIIETTMIRAKYFGIAWIPTK
jgi:hypothetical protein